MKRAIAVAIGGVALLAAGIALTQNQQNPPPAPTGPTPTEASLTPDRAEIAALGQARQDPMAARSRSILQQDRQRAPVLAAIQASTVPVLGPPDPALLRTARFHTGDRQYVLIVRGPGRVVEIFGATKALQPPPGAVIPPPQPRGRVALTRVSPIEAARAQAAERGLANILSEQTEYGVDVSFSRFGAVYNVSFICDSLGPPDCTEAAAVAFAANLTLLGGGQ